MVIAGVEDLHRHNGAAAPPAAAPAAAVAEHAAAAAAEAAAAACAGPAPCRARLSTVYEGAAPPTRLSDVFAAAERGERCLVLSGVVVAGVVGAGGSETRVEHLVRARCHACGHTCSWGAAGGDTSAAKRCRRALPCGHWAFGLEYRFRLELQEAAAGSGGCALGVGVSDATGELLGVTPTDVVADPAARCRAQQLLDALRSDPQASPASAPWPGHTLAVVRVDSPADPAGVYVLCDTRAVWENAPVA